MTHPCNEALVRHSYLDHGELRALMPDGRCPVCDPTVTREEYRDVVYRISVDPEARARVLRKT